MPGWYFPADRSASATTGLADDRRAAGPEPLHLRLVREPDLRQGLTAIGERQRRRFAVGLVVDVDDQRIGAVGGFDSLHGVHRELALRRPVLKCHGVRVE